MKAAQPPLGVIVLAAGQGKRMRSSLPKVLHELAGEPMIVHVLKSVRDAVSHASVCVIVGHGREQVEAAVRGHPLLEGLDIHFVVQAEQKGTGHAARCAMDSPWGETQAKAKSSILILPGDQPLITAALISSMVEPLGRNAAMRMLTCELQDPNGYGRVVRRGKKGPVLRIVEQRDASDRDKLIREVATSIYFVHSNFLKVALQKLSNKNAQGEYYLTDTVAQASRAKKTVDVVIWENEQDLRGINDPWELALAQKYLNERIIERHARAGVKFQDPWSTQVDLKVTISEGAIVHLGAILRGRTQIGAGAVVGPRCVLNDVEVGAGVVLKTGTVGEQSKIGAQAQVGPYAHLRPGSQVGESAKIGNFVELKNTQVGANTNIAHLSYLGDAVVGARVNIGCGFITCNFDGRVIDGQRKHRTIIEDDVFLGSDCQAIAPLKVGRGAYVASGSTLTEDVEADALAIARSRQVNKPGYARKLRTS